MKFYFLHPKGQIHCAILIFCKQHGSATLLVRWGKQPRGDTDSTYSIIVLPVPIITPPSVFLSAYVVLLFLQFKEQYSLIACLYLYSNVCYQRKTRGPFMCFWWGSLNKPKYKHFGIGQTLKSYYLWIYQRFLHPNKESIDESLLMNYFVFYTVMSLFKNVPYRSSLSSERPQLSILPSAPFCSTSSDQWNDRPLREDRVPLL